MLVMSNLKTCWEQGCVVLGTTCPCPGELKIASISRNLLLVGIHRDETRCKSCVCFSESHHATVDATENYRAAVR